MPTKASLNLKQKRFCREYLKDFNGQQAAIRAGYSERSAKEQASFLLTKHNIMQYIEHLEKGEIADWKITKEDIIQKWVDLVFNASTVEVLRKFHARETMTDFLNSLSEHEEGIIKEVTQTSKEHSTDYNIKFHDPLKAMEVLSKHLGIFKETTENAFSFEKLISAAIGRGKNKE